MWRYANPVTVVFGAGSLDRIGELVGGRAWCLVTYGDAHFTELTARISGLAGAPDVVINNVTPNPNYESLGAACNSFAGAARAPEVVVAVGGGSAIDSGKVLSVARGDFSSTRSFVETGQGREQLRPIPLIAIPTTAGTGSEVTRFATVWDRGANKKRSLTMDEVFPEYALVDPDLSMGAPLDLTVSTGLDVLSHALESIWNVNASPITTNFSVFAAREVLDCLPDLSKDLSNADLRSRMARAATIAGLAISNTQTALAHTLSYPLTLKFGIPHGIACSFCLPMVMDRAIGATPECDDALKRVFGDDLKAGVERLSTFIRDLGISTNAEDHGMAEEEWTALVQSALTDGLGRSFLQRQQPGR